MERRRRSIVKRWIGWMLAAMIIVTSGNMPMTVWANEFSDGTDVDSSESSNISDSEETFTDMEQPDSEEDIAENILTDENEEDNEVVPEEAVDVFAAGTTQSEFEQKLSQLRSKYPNYSVWNDWFDGGHQCFGFARLMGYEVFGSKPSTWSKAYNVYDVKAGDLIQYGNTSGQGHTVFVTKVEGNTITFVDCNGNGNYSGGTKVRSNGVKWDNTITKGSQMFGKYSFSYILVSPGVSPDPAPDPVEPSYSDFYVSQSVYSLHDIIEFKITPINATNIGISIDKEGVGRVVAGDCNRTDGHTLWGINLGVGKYSAHITVYNGSRWVDTYDVYFSVVPPEYSGLSVTKEKFGTNENIQFNINTSHTEWMVIGVDKEGEGRVYTGRCGDSVNGWSMDAGILGVGKYTAYFSLYSTNDYWLDTEKVSFSVYDPDAAPSYSDFSVSKSVYNLHDIIEFKVNPINATNIGISIDKEGIGRVVAGDCNRADGHTLWGINLGVGKYSAHITVYNGSKWVDTNEVHFSVVPPEYTDLSVSKKRFGINENVQFNINTSHTEWMVIGIDREGEGRVYTGRCGDSVNGWSMSAGDLGVGRYTAYFSLYSTNDYWLDTETVSFSVYDPDGVPSYSDFSVSKSKYDLDDIIEFKVNPVNETNMKIKIDKEGTGRVIEKDCNGISGHTLKGSDLGAGKYRAHITVYNGEKWVDTDEVSFSVTAPEVLSVSLKMEKNPVISGESVRLYAQAQGGTGGYTYKFIICDDKGNWYKLRDYGEGSTYIWTPGAAGQKTLYVDVKDSSGEVKRSELSCEVKKKVEALTAKLTADPLASAASGSEVKLTASANGGSGSYTYKFLICDDKGNWYKIRDFEKGSTCTWIPGAVGKKTLYVDVKDSSGEVKRAELSYEVKKKAEPLTAKLTADPLSSAVSGSEVKLTASANGGNGSYTYKFLICDDKGNWYKIRDFEKGSTCTWIPGAVGKKTLYVDVKDSSGEIKRAELSYEVKKKVEALTVKLIADPSANAVSGSRVKLTASANGGNGSYTYKFLICDDKGNWYKIRDFESSNTCSWTPGATGKKTLYVDVKDSAGEVKRAELAYEVKAK